MAQCVTTGRAEGSYRIRHQAKGAIWVRVIGRRLGEWEGLPVIVVNFLNTTKEIEVHDSLLDNSGNIVYICDAKTQELLYANKIALETWGKVDYLGHRCYEFIKGKSEPCHWCPMIQGKALPSEWVEFHDRIENRYYHILWRPLEWHGKEAVAVYGIDITTSKRNEKQLQAEKSSLEHTIGHIPSGICVFERKDSVITCLSVNPYYADMIGLSATELTGTTLPEFLSRVHGADWRRYASDISLWLDESDNSHGEYRLYNKRKQRYLWIHWEGRRAIMQDGREILYCSYTDVTERKEAEAALLTSRTRYSQAIQSASLAVWEYDIEGHRLLLPDDETARYALKR